MATAQVSSSVTGLTELIGRLEKAQQAMEEGPGEEVMREMGEEGMLDIDVRYATQGYGTWQPLSPVTVSKKGHGTILIDTATMKQSTEIVEVTANSVVVRVPVGGKDAEEYVPLRHQLGDTNKNLPQRKIVEDTPHLRARLGPYVKKWMESWR